MIVFILQYFKVQNKIGAIQFFQVILSAQDYEKFKEHEQSVTMKNKVMFIFKIYIQICCIKTCV